MNGGGEMKHNWREGPAWRFRCLRCGLQRRPAKIEGRINRTWLYWWEAAGEWITATRKVPACKLYPKMVPRITGDDKPDVVE